ncbi:MAG: heat shock protein HspQ [Granulosicoccus sp.]
MIKIARFRIGQVVRHRVFPFRGLIYDVDPVFDNTNEWYEAIPKSMRPAKDQPFYHLYAQNNDAVYEAYVSEQNLLIDDSGDMLRHPNIAIEFIQDAEGAWRVRNLPTH